MKKYREGREPYFARKARENTAKRHAADPGYVLVLRARARVDYSTHRERRLKVNRRYARAHVPLRNMHSGKRRALQKGAETFLFTLKDWERLKVRYRNCCSYCGKFSARLHKEHVIPLERGGRHSLGNILPACPTCNYSKQDSYVMEWRMRRIRIRRELELRAARKKKRLSAHAPGLVAAPK
ncbi:MULTISPECIES: HNH endonuclease [Arthrobacter]|nr:MULTISPECIES: HNH endonuclease [Arthrobacter]MBT8159610.1 HNH endonuclease [Arthrobacter sp. GN70]